MTAPLSKLIASLRSLGSAPDGGEWTDGQLLECFLKHREESAFKALVRRHGPMVMGVCRRLLGHAEDAEDAFQATFLVLARKAGSVTPREKVGNWLHGVAYNIARKARAVAVKRKTREKQVNKIPEPGSPPDHLWGDLLPLLDEELSRLPANQRLAVVLCDIEGRSYQEAARHLGCPEGSLAGWLSRARKTLARRLSKRGVTLSSGALTALLGERATAGVAPALVVRTTQAAGLFAAGRLATAVVSAQAATLADGMVKALLLSRLRFLLSLTVLLLLTASAIGVGVVLSRDGDDPPPTPPTDRVALPAREPEGRPAPQDVAGRNDVRIPVRPGIGVTFGPPGCPVVVVGSKVWHLEHNQVIQELEGDIEPRALRALSRTGRWFAAASQTPNRKDTSVRVWSVQTGRKVFEVPGHKDAFVDLLTFAGDRSLLLGGRQGNTIDVWQVETGTRSKSIAVPLQRVQGRKIAVSPDGQRFACMAHDKMFLVEAETGRVMTTLTSPPEAVFVFAWTRALCFSPDGKELAACSLQRDPRLLCWNLQGDLVVDRKLPIPRIVGPGNSLNWLPDRSGWLINGYLVDRASGRVVLHVRKPFGSEVLPHLLGRDQVLGVVESDDSQLRTMAIPWVKIRASLQQLSAPTPAFLRPGQSVSLVMEFSPPGRDTAEMRRVLREALTTRLGQEGILVADNQPTRFRVKLTEQGATPEEIRGLAELEVVSAGRPDPLWHEEWIVFPSREAQREGDPTTIWASMLEHLTMDLKRVDLPYFIPRSPDGLTLPGVIE